MELSGGLPRDEQGNHRRASPRQETTISGGPAVQDDVRPLLVFFYSPRSGPARRMESLLAHLARKERDRLRIKRVDVEAHPELPERFGVTEVPSVVVVKAKRVVDRIDSLT